MKNNKPLITLFYCINSFTEKSAKPLMERDDLVIKLVKMPCSSMVKDVFLLRAFESGSDAVGVLVCAEDRCRYVEGSRRAKKRVERTQQIMNEIGLDSSRLFILNYSAENQLSLGKILQKIVKDLSDAGRIKAAA